MPLHVIEAKVVLAHSWRSGNNYHKKLISLSIISTSLTVPGQPSPQFHVKVWLPTRNCEMDYLDTRLYVCRVLAARCALNGHISRVSHDTLTLEKK